MMIAGKERGKAKAKAKAKVKAKALSACLPNFPMACRRPLVGCRFALIIILAAVSGRSPMASAIVACMCVALKVASNVTTFMPLALNERRSDYVPR